MLSKGWTHHSVANLYTMLYCSTHLPQQQTIHPSRTCKVMLPYKYVFNPQSFDTCCYSVVKSCPTLRDPMDHSTLGLPVLHCLPEFTQIHAHCIGDAI